MRHPDRATRIPISVGAVLTAALLLAVLPIAADETEPQTEPQAPALGVAGNAATRPAPKSLGAFASAVKLNRAAAPTTEEGMVISDHNLPEVAQQGKISAAGGLHVAAARTAATPEQASAAGTGVPVDRPKDPLQQQYDDEKANLDGMEKGYEDFENRVEKRRERSAYESYLAQNRPGGVDSRTDQERARAQADIDAQRQRIDRTRRKARREGKKLEDE